MRRSRWTFVVFALLALIVAGALAYNYTQPTSPPLPSEQVERRGEGRDARTPGVTNMTADSANLPPSAQNEIDCVDRLLSSAAPADVDQKAEWDRCRALGDAAVAAEARREQEAEAAGNTTGSATGNRAAPRP